MLALIDKLCPRCKVQKPIDQFHRDQTSKDGFAFYCSECANTASRAWRKLPGHQARINQIVTRRIRERKLKAIEHFGNKCHDCGGTFPPCVYDFHHIDGSKDMNPSAALKRSWENALNELNKCVLLCVNCHRIRHFA